MYTVGRMGKTIVICASASCFKRAAEVGDALEERGFGVLLPDVATMMRESGDYRVETYKTWFADPGDYGKKKELLLSHYRKIERGDLVLVVNEEKDGMPGYVGGAVLMELGVAMMLDKPIYVLNPVSEKLPVYEEVLGSVPTFLDGDLDKIPL